MKTYETEMKIFEKIAITAFAAMALVMSSCEDSVSYSDLLRDEERATNWYMAQQTIALDIPEDSVFQEGPDAPFYKMDEEGYLYMRVVNSGDKDRRPKKSDTVYFRWMRQNIKLLYETGESYWSGNSDDLNGQTSTSLIYGYPELESCSTYGTGIQVPLDYLGYDSEVELVIRSYQGFTSDQSQCIPYIYKVRYFAAEY